MRNINNSDIADICMKDKETNSFVIEQCNFITGKARFATVFVGARSMSDLQTTPERVAIFRVIKTRIPLSVRLHNKGIRNNAIALTPSMNKDRMLNYLQPCFS